MADPPNWLRSFGRSRSSTPTISPTTQTHHSIDFIQISTRHHHHGGREPAVSSPTAESSSSPPRHRKSASATLRTVSSFLSIKGGVGKGGNGTTRVASLPAAEADQLDVSGAQLLAMMSPVGDGPDYAAEQAEKGERAGADKTWHNPNLMQMAETLGTVMMTGGATEGLPVAYNSCVLALIEGFYRLTRQLRGAEKELDELKISRKMELEQFRGMTEEWMEKAETYRAEIKRLELLLAAESKGGMACVALARHGSLVDRAGSKRFQARLKRISGPEDQGAVKVTGHLPFGAKHVSKPVEAASNVEGAVVVPRILDSQNDILVSRAVEEREMQEQRARQQLGRARAAPVLVRPHADRDARDEHANAPARHGPPTYGNGHVKKHQQTDHYADKGVPPDDTPRQRPLLPVTTDVEASTENESTSSDPDSSPETSLSAYTSGAPSAQREQQKPVPSRARRGKKLIVDTNISPPTLPTSLNHRQEKGDTQDPASRTRTVEHKPEKAKSKSKTKPKRPSLFRTGHLSFHHHHQQPPRKQHHQRGYSFEKGDDEVLSVTPSPTTWGFPPGAHQSSRASNERSSNGNHNPVPAATWLLYDDETDYHHHGGGGGGDLFPAAAFGMGNGIRPDGEGIAALQNQLVMSEGHWSAAAVTHSASTGTVKWVGGESSNGDETGRVGE